MLNQCTLEVKCFMAYRDHYPVKKLKIKGSEMVRQGSSTLSSLSKDSPQVSIEVRPR